MYIDIFLGVFVLIGLIQGYSRGIVRTIFSIAGFVFGVLAAMKFSPLVVSLFDQVFGWDPLISLILGLVLTFVLIMWGINWLGRGVEKTLKAVRLNGINKAFGAVLFAGLMIVTYSAIIWFLGRTELIGSDQYDSSISYPYLKQIPLYTSEAFEAIKPVFKGFWDKIEAVIES